MKDSTHNPPTDLRQNAYKRLAERLAPNLPSYPTSQPTQPMALLLPPLPINGRPSTAPQDSPTSSGGTQKLLWGRARPGRRDAGGIFADGHPPTAQLLTAPSRSLVWAVRRINIPPADSPMGRYGLARLMQPLRADCSVVD
jgi:hypothetical protein